ncbi:epididymal protein 13 [Peromyscus eremicus]|uniref:epididymal protein 13 n=1 Tax=Peromyscus eremicus TaxID=42410 RepID=UPI0027DD437B|nr:epididymal protein 13 [Peromyscus eremicus]
MCRLEPFLKRSLVVLLFLGLTEACIPREVAMEEKSKNCRYPISPVQPKMVLNPPGYLPRLLSDEITGLLSLQVLNEETNDCQEEVKSPPATTTAKVLVRHGRWSFLRCAYMVMTFFFVSYNKGDWCYCHYCNPDMDVRDDPCCSF